MLLVLAFIINILAPIVNSLGILGLCGCIINGDVHILVIAAILAVIGLIFGIFAYHLDIPPRWFWSHSANEIFEFSVTAVLGYAWNFAMWACAIYLIQLIVDSL